MPRLTTGVFLCPLFFDLLGKVPEIMPHDIPDTRTVGWVPEGTEGSFHVDGRDAVKIKLEVAIPI